MLTNIAIALYMLFITGMLFYQKKRHTTETTLLLSDIDNLNSKMLDQIALKDAEIDLANEVIAITNRRLDVLGEQHDELQLQRNKARELNFRLSDELDKLRQRELPQLHEMNQENQTND